MRSLAGVIVAVFLSAFVANEALAQFSNSGVPGAQQGDVHVPWSRNYLPLLPNQPIQYRGGRSYRPGFGGSSFFFGTGYGWGGGYPYWYDGPYYPGPIVLPPLYLPAEELYGPQSVKRFMGIDGPQVSAPTVIVANKPDRDAALPAKPKLRISNAAMKAQAGKFMAFGDTLFQKQNFNSALVRYQTATKSASDIPEPFFRQGFALVAMGKYESAARAMRRALLVQNDPTKWHLSLNDLYVDNKIAKSAHLEALAQSIEENPDSADLLMLLGLHLYFDGQADRATPLFERCNQLGGNEDGALTGLLPVPEKPAPNDGGRDL